MLGEVVGVVVFTTKGTFIECNLLLVCLLAVNKLTRCLNPLGTLHVPALYRRLVSGSVMCVFLVNWGWYFTLTITGYFVVFYSELLCDLYATTSDNNKYSTVELGLVGVFLLLPTIVLCVASGVLVYVAVSLAHSAVKKKNIAVTILVCVFFLLYVLPFVVWFAIYESQTGMDGMLKTSFSIYSSRIIFQLETISVFVNPAVYYITMKRFRGFCKRYFVQSGPVSRLADSQIQSVEPHSHEPSRTLPIVRPAYKMSESC